jgi:hypothetical protein
MSTSGYGRQRRNVRPIDSSFIEVSTGLTQYKSAAFGESQETISYRSDIAGEPYLESDIDPYAWFLQDLAARKLASNGETRSVTDLSVDGKIIAYSPHRDNGHAFRTQKRTARTSVRKGYCYASYGKQFYGGPFFALGAQVIPDQRGDDGGFRLSANGYNEVASIPYIGHQTDLTAFGQKAITVLAPGFSRISVFASIGELVAGFPKLFGEAIYSEVRRASKHRETRFTGIVSASKGAAGEFLNIIFGVSPTLQDVSKFVDSMQSATETLLQLQADSGHGVRRRMNFTMDQKEVTYSGDQLSSHGFVLAGLGNFLPGYHGYPDYSASTEVENLSIDSSVRVRQFRKVAFTGSFSRFLPTAPGLEGSMQRFLQDWDHILGTKPTFERIWQLIPFSWLIDWVLDVQSSLALYERIQDESLVINYGYVLGSTQREVVQDSKLTYKIGKKSSFSQVRSVYTSSVKERWRANPFGFTAPSSVELNPLRMAILGAVALTGGKPN